MRINQELHGSIATAFSAPNTNQEKHRNKHNFPENIKQEKIQGRKNTQNTSFQHQQKAVIKRRAFCNVPGINNHQKTKQGCQHKQRQGKTIQAQRKGNAKSREPICFLQKLITVSSSFITGQHHQTADKNCPSADYCHIFRQLRLTAQKQQQQRAN